MAETDTAAASTTTPPVDTSSSTDSVTSAPPPPPAKPVIKCWADEEDDPPEEPEKTEAPPSTSDQPELEVAALKITENKFLDDPEDSNISAVTAGDTPYTSASTFEDLNLPEAVLKGLYVEMGFKKPSKIQAITLPMILTPPYKDLVAQAHNGSGKTTCFVLGMLGRVDPNVKAPQALCICPTRELAIQNMEVLQKMGKYTGVTSECAVPADRERNAPSPSFRAPVTAQIVIGTPGTIKRWMSTKKLGVSRVKVLVFDEADHMLAEDGFQDDSLRIKRDTEKVSPNCQVLLFSATFNERVTNFVSRVVKRGNNQLFVKKEELSLEGVKQYKVYCPDELSKIEVIKTKIFDLGEKLGQRIIFVRTKNSARMLYQQLSDDGYAVTAIQGALNTEDRDKIIKEFKDGLTQVLISTDVLARGFDQQQVNCVVNYDLPVKYSPGPRSQPVEPDYEVYLHRIGRAGRFGRKGAVFNLICDDNDELVMSKIEQYFDIKVPEVKNTDEAFEGALKTAGLL
ncbi:putative RNA helicase [Rosa chinensis]|uniref:RNA helicase n=1 Tax=Rosa chinensis TaxID=74649 RepID=A0A2P6RBB4_ROSCH|nr:DEAD-box ATP-dependent RNA helicase 38 [Rosa chinensis]PRQ43713.1 putative RNA helicase [Rosa chinensis]